MLRHRVSTRAPRASLQPTGYSWTNAVPGEILREQVWQPFEIIISPELEEKAGRAAEINHLPRETLWMDGEDEENNGMRSVGERWLWRREEREIRINTGEMEPRPEHWNKMTAKEQWQWQKTAVANQPHMMIRVVTDYGSTRVEHRDDGWTRQVVMYEKGTVSPYDFYHVNTDPFQSFE